jgi:hypothetical protein
MRCVEELVAKKKIVGHILRLIGVWMRIFGA